MDHFHVSATGHSINYFPEYLARELGYFADVELKVTADVPQPWTRVLKDLNVGTAQAALGGIWVPSMYRTRVHDYTAFAQLSARCPLVLVSRKPVQLFDWAFLENKIVLVPGGNGASPFMFLKDIIKRNRFDLNRVRFVHDLDMAMLAELFAGGMGDIFVTDPLTAASLVHNGAGYEVASLTEVGGPIPWSVYYTHQELIERNDNLVGRFTQGLQRATTWIREHDAEEAREVVCKYWPNNVDVVINILNFFRKQGMWDETVQIDENAHTDWQEIMANTGIIDKPLRHDEICDTRPYEFAFDALR
jgi:NitT/TauT family transport system substrate-binding protein